MPAEQFRIDPLVVFKLGEELISDEPQALLELIKNAYDADATYAQLKINTTGAPAGLLLAPDEQRGGYIEVSDDGAGMTEAQIRDGWLLIAKSTKRAFKREGKVTPKKRTPLGDKGLGRLGTQRLGWIIQIATKTADAKKERVIAFSWEDFVTADTLDQVQVEATLRSPQRAHGTVLTIAELRNSDHWTGDHLLTLQERLAEVISPYGGVAGFTVTASVDGTDLDLQSLSRDVLDTAQLHYDIKFSTNKLTISGRASLGLFRPTGTRALNEYREFVEEDDGTAFFAHLMGIGADEKIGFKSGRGRWFAAFKRTRSLADMAPQLNDNGAPATPGPFTAEVDSFSLASGNDAALRVFGKLNEYREFIKKLSGIRVYRDGFVVRTDADWLRLGEQWTSASSYYGLKPDTTLGYVAISSRDNAQLVEKTDREGFVDNPAYRNFVALMTEFRRFTEEVQDLLRREYLTFVKERVAEEADVVEDTDAEGVSDSIDETLGEAEGMKAAVATAQAAMSKAMADAKEAGESANSDDNAAARDRSMQELQDAIREAQSTLDALDGFLAQLETAQSRNRLLREEIIQMREQLEAGVETMGLGLTAEALSHEMFTIADGLAVRTQNVVSGLEAGTMDFAKVRRYVQYVRGSVGSLRKELAHFSPSLRFVRERREDVNVPEFIEELAEYYRRRWEADNIHVTVRDVARRPFIVRTGRGRLTQVLDNLLLNSGYWVGVAKEQRAITNGEVMITVRAPRITIADNGPGVEPSVESSLFDAFVTRKPRGTGRGLGLFVVRQLLDSQDSTIELGPQRDDHGRRHDFIVNLSGMLDGR